MSDRIVIPEIILASTSPRRQMLLRQIAVPFRVIPPAGIEQLPRDSGDISQVVVRNAETKARSVLSKAYGMAVLGADTLVELDSKAPLGKPVDAADAKRMLKALSGRDHFVYTGIALIDSGNGTCYRDHAVTRVFFRKLTEVEIDDYIASGEPMDKAGSYGIQERGAVFIHRVEGCFFNVMGLPLAKLWEMLIRWIQVASSK